VFFFFKPMENAAGRFTIILRLDRLSVRRLLALQNRQAWRMAMPSKIRLTSFLPSEANR
jgi:hypothetical protein